MNSCCCVSTYRHHCHLPLGGLQPSGASRVGSVWYHLSISPSHHPPCHGLQTTRLHPGHQLQVDHSIFYNRIKTQKSNIYKNGKTKKRFLPTKKIWLSIPQVSFFSCSPRTHSAQTIEQKSLYDPVRLRSVYLEKLLLLFFALFYSPSVFFWNMKHTQARQPQSE